MSESYRSSSGGRNQRPAGDASARGRGPRDRGARHAKPRQDHPSRPEGPALPDSVLYTDLDAEVRAQLRVLPKEVAEVVGRHLVAAGQLLDEDPALALKHAQAARTKAPRFGIVREAVAEAAYHSGDWHTALMELRAARRVTGNDAYLPMIIDCERALGRVEKARQLLDESRSRKLDVSTRVELAILSAGMHREDGDLAKAITEVSIPELRSKGQQGWLARLRYSYAELLLESGKKDDAALWFDLAAQADPDEETDALDRKLELEGVALGEEPAPEPSVEGHAEATESTTDAGPSTSA